MLDAWISWLALLGPIALLLAGLWRRHAANDGPRLMARRAEAAAAAALVTALATLMAWAAPGGRGHAAAGAMVYIDALSAIMLTLVSFVGVMVVRFSRNYLDGDPQQVRFFRLLCLTLGGGADADRVRQPRPVRGRLDRHQPRSAPTAAVLRRSARGPVGRTQEVPVQPLRRPLPDRGSGADLVVVRRDRLRDDPAHGGRHGRGRHRSGRPVLDCRPPGRRGTPEVGPVSLSRLASGSDGDTDARLRAAACRHHQRRRLPGAALR